MTREELLDGLYEIKNWKCNGDAKTHEVVSEAIKVLKQGPCEDCISRREAEDNVCRMRNDKEFYMQYADTVEDGKQFGRAVERMIYAMPSVVSQPKTGHWIYDENIQNWRCSRCNETPKTLGYTGNDVFMHEHFKFCNHCGAKMINPQESEEV